MAALLLAASLVASACASSSQGPRPNVSASSQATDAGGVAPGGGDIPDNQTYLTYRGGGFAIQYPEGWAVVSSSAGASFRDRDNRIDVTIRTGPAPSAESVRAETAATNGASISTQPHSLTLPAGPAVVVTYQVDGASNAVTGKRPRLSVDRYEIGHAGTVAVLDMASPAGADNVDAYRMIVQSFTWQ